MIDLKKIARGESGRLYNLHSHTQFCDGRATMEDFVVAAIGAGFTDFGFSPHSPINIESPCNMSFDAVDDYLTEFNRLKVKYMGDINLYASMEIDYLSEEWNASNDYFRKLPLDYRIGSVHFVPNADGVLVDLDGRFERFKVNIDELFGGDLDYAVRRYFAQSLRMIEAGGFDIIAHFDKIGHNASHYRADLESEQWYQKLIMELLEAIKDNNIIVEVNSKAFKDHNRFFPNKRLFSLLKRYDIPLLVNSDVHYPELVNSGRFEAFECIDLV
ncbi:MAG: histidinol-phosphatase [Bacteroidales bacterium]